MKTMRMMRKDIDDPDDANKELSDEDNEPMTV